MIDIYNILSHASHTLSVHSVYSFNVILLWVTHGEIYAISHLIYCTDNLLTRNIRCHSNSWNRIEHSGW